jgi:hypothetical protein
MWCADVCASLIEEREKERALERMKAGKRLDEPYGQLTTGFDTGKSRDKVAATVGMSESKE